MPYQIDLQKPLFFLWAGLFTNTEEMVYRHRETHHSENFEIFFAIKNDIILTINDELIHIKENELFVVPPYAHITSTVDIDYELRFYWFHFIASYTKIEEDNRYLTSGISEVSQLKKETSLNNVIILPERYQFNQPENIVVQINQLLNHTNRYTYTQRGNDFFLTLLLIAICDEYLKALAAQQINTTKKTVQIAEWIRVNIHQELSLVTIANHFQLNPNYLSRLFKEEQGIGIKEYSLTVKLNIAKKLLVTTNLTIEEISDQSFFSDTKHFMRLFKQKSGLTPTQYRLKNSHINYNSGVMNPPDPLPSQLGNKALQELLFNIIQTNSSNTP